SLSSPRSIVRVRRDFFFNRLRSISPSSFGRFKLVVSHPLSDAISQRTRDYMRDAVKQHLPVSRPPSSDTHTFPIVSSRWGLPLLHPPLGSSGCSVTAKHPLFSCYHTT